MSDILCIYYSRTGHTRRAVKEIATQRSEEVYDQMDMYTGQAHRLAVSLRPDSEGYEFWRNDFIQNVRRLLEND